jgi:hypothetical protein
MIGAIRSTAWRSSMAQRDSVAQRSSTARRSLTAQDSPTVQRCSSVQQRREHVAPLTTSLQFLLAMRDMRALRADPRCVSGTRRARPHRT